MRWPRRRHEVNGIEMKSFLRRFGHRNVPGVNRVKGATKKRNGPPVAMSVGFLRRLRTQSSSPGGAARSEVT